MCNDILSLWLLIFLIVIFLFKVFFGLSNGRWSDSWFPLSPEICQVLKARFGMWGREHGLSITITGNYSLLHRRLNQQIWGLEGKLMLVSWLDGHLMPNGDPMQYQNVLHRLQFLFLLWIFFHFYVILPFCPSDIFVCFFFFFFYSNVEIIS